MSTESKTMKRPSARKSAPKRKSNPARKSKVSDTDLAHWRKMYPRGTEFFAVQLSRSPSGTRVVKFLHAPAKNEIYAVPPGVDQLGFRYSDKKGGFIFTGGGYSASDHFVENLGWKLYGDDRAFKTRASV